VGLVAWPRRAQGAHASDIVDQQFGHMGRWFDVFATPIGTAGRFAIVFKDQTVKRAADRALQQGALWNAFRAELLDAMRSQPDVGLLQGRSAELLGESLGAFRVHYAELDATMTYGVVRADSCREGISSIVGTHRLDDFGPDVMNAVRAGLTVRIDDSGTDSRLDDVHRAATVALGIGAYVMVPVVRTGRAVAALTVHHGEPHEWTDDELAIIDEVAQRTWAAVDVTSVEAKRRQRHGRSDLIAQLLADLELDDSLEEQTQRCCDMFVAATFSESTSAFCDYATIEVPADAMPLVALAHADPNMVDTLLTLRRFHRIDAEAANSVGRAAAGEAQLLAHVDAITRSEYATSPEVVSLLDRLGTRSHMAVPLHMGGGVRGALMVGITRPDRYPFDAEDLEFLKTTADRIGIVLAATQLRRHEHAVSHRLQKALLPDSLVDTPHLEVTARYQAASAFMEVDGDWCDSFSWPSGHVGFMVGDVVGHNLESAAVMGRLRAGMAALAPNLEPSPRCLARRASAVRSHSGRQRLPHRRLRDHRHGDRQTHLFTGGAWAPFLVSPHGHVVVLDQAQTPPLCLIDLIERSEAIVAITPGDHLVMYTDGLLERRGMHPDVGIERLQSALTSLHHLPITILPDHLITSSPP
jgi:GAF domain-containing protein